MLLLMGDLILEINLKYICILWNTDLSDDSFNNQVIKKRKKWMQSLMVTYP